MGKRRSDVTFMVCKLDGDEAIGVWRLQNVDPVNRVCEVGVDIFPALRLQGFGYKTYRLILLYLFDHYNIHMIYLRTAEFNKAGWALYTKVGFRETGRLIQSIFRHGRYWDNILMCLTVDEYRAIYSQVEGK
jgi:RimJ/RimL family protein N-acetyltransferase